MSQEMEFAQIGAQVMIGGARASIELIREMVQLLGRVLSISGQNAKAVTSFLLDAARNSPGNKHLFKAELFRGQGATLYTLPQGTNLKELNQLCKRLNVSFSAVYGREQDPVGIIVNVENIARFESALQHMGVVGQDAGVIMQDVPIPTVEVENELESDVAEAEEAAKNPMQGESLSDTKEADSKDIQTDNTDDSPKETGKETSEEVDAKSVQETLLGTEAPETKSKEMASTSQVATETKAAGKAEVSSLAKESSPGKENRSLVEKAKELKQAKEKAEQGIDQVKAVASKPGADR